MSNLPTNRQSLWQFREHFCSLQYTLHDFIKAFQDSGIHINTQDDIDNTILDYACMHNRDDISAWLKSQSARHSIANRAAVQNSNPVEEIKNQQLPVQR